MAQFNLGRVKGDKGEKGDKGVSFNFTGAWEIGVAYKNDEFTIDVVSYSGNAYACKVSHTSTAETAPPNTSNWDLLLSNAFDLIQTDTIADANKPPSSVVTEAHGREIDELYNNFVTQYGALTPGDFDLSNPTPSYNYVKKSGKIVQLGININVNSINSADSAKLICTLPANFRPTRNMYLVGRAVIDGKYTSVYVYILINGSVNVILPAGTTTAIGLNTTWIMD